MYVRPLSIEIWLTSLRNSMFLHRYQDVADTFLKVFIPSPYPEWILTMQQLTELNSWSHALFHYFAAVSYVELYRMHYNDPVKAVRLFCFIRFYICVLTTLPSFFRESTQKKPKPY